MSQERLRPRTNRQIIEEAAEWFVELNEDDANGETRRRFHAWLQLSPEHVRAYLQILPVWEEGAGLDTANGDPRALIASTMQASNIVPLGAPEAKAQRRDEHRITRIIKRVSVAASLALAAVAVVAWAIMTRDVYGTGIREQRLIVLDDGSRVELNARSRVKVRFTDQERLVDLLEGQALFRVAKDTERPFIVQSGHALVRAVGTQFDVYRKRSGTIVTVLEGEVAVSSYPSPTAGAVAAESRAAAGQRGPTTTNRVRAIPLTAGQQVMLTSWKVARPQQVDVAAATAWTQQQLVFFRTPLAEVAEEFNRYNHRRLLVMDERLRTFRISGTFPSTDPTSLIRFLQAQPELHVEEARDRVVVELR